MQIDERTVGDVVVLNVTGEITLGVGEEMLRDKVNSLVAGGQHKLVFDLAQVPYIDSAGLAEIVRAYTTVTRLGGSLELINLSKKISDEFWSTRLLRLFKFRK